MGSQPTKKRKLLNRVWRIRGQVEAIERELNDEVANAPRCCTIFRACWGAMDALMAEVIEGHIRFHILDANVSSDG